MVNLLRRQLQVMDHGAAPTSRDRYGISIYFILMKSVDVGTEYLPNISPVRIEHCLYFLPVQVHQVASLDLCRRRDMHGKDNVACPVPLQRLSQKSDLLVRAISTRIIQKNDHEIVCNDCVRREAKEMFIPGSIVISAERKDRHLNPAIAKINDIPELLFRPGAGKVAQHENGVTLLP